MSTFIFYWRRPTPPLFIGGAEITQNVLAKQLAKNYNVIYVGSLDDPNYPSDYLKQSYLNILHNDNKIKNFKYFDNNNYSYEYYNIKCFLLSQIDLENKIKSYIDINDDIYFITGMEQSSNFINIANSLNITTIAWLHSININEIKCINSNPKIILSTSQYVKNFILQKFNLESFLFYPPFEKEDSLIEKNQTKFVTFINPIKEKGSELFLKIANILSNINFLVVEGWYKNIDFIKSKSDNIIYLEKQVNINNVWEKTKLLLVPSKIEEAFGRVIVEASQKYIPVIASNRGGIVEALNNSGTIVNRDAPRLWANIIMKYLNNNIFYNIESRKAFEKSNFFYKNKIIDFFKIIGLD